MSDCGLVRQHFTITTNFITTTVTIILVIKKVIMTHITTTMAITIILTITAKVVTRTTVTLGMGHQHPLSAMASGSLKSLFPLDSYNYIRYFRQVWLWARVRSAWFRAALTPLTGHSSGYFGHYLSYLYIEMSINYSITRLV